MNGPALVLIEHDRGVLADTATQALTLARQLVEAGAATEVQAVLIGADADALADDLGRFGVRVAWCAHHDALTDYGPEVWGDVLAQIAEAASPSAVLASGTDRGNEVLAHLAAIMDAPFAANVVAVTPTVTPTDTPTVTAFLTANVTANVTRDGTSDVTPPDTAAWGLTRVRWGGSLLEHALLRAPIKIISAAVHSFSGEPADGVTTAPETRDIAVALADDAARTRIVERITLATGITLTTAPVVVSGGRGVGSPEGFAVLEELARLLGGAVGCSRVVTNNGWRPHADQVGQTGKRVAPELYIACGISGAIQHWVGMMTAKHVLAINLDGDANMVSRADYAVIGDLHEVLPAVIAELKARRT